MDRRLLLFRAGPRLCGLSVEHVIEVMRPLPTQPVPGAPDFVVGAALIRGQPVPVVDLHALLSTSRAAPPSRMILLRLGAARRAALLTDDVHGISPHVDRETGDHTPLFADAAVVERVGRVDEDLLTVLSTAHLLPETFWQGWASHGAIS